LKLNVSKKLAFVVPALIAGTMFPGTVAMAATNHSQVQKHFTSESSSSIAAINGFEAKVFAQGTASMSNPDDLTILDGKIYVGYQNGVGSKGEASSTGVTSSTIVAYDKNGKVVGSWAIKGKCDGLTADAANHRIIASVNEDGNSSMYIIKPGNTHPQHLTYSPDPSTLQGGGTDSIAVQNGNIYITASNPTADANGNYTHAALFKGTIQGNTVHLSPVVMGNATATDVSSGKPVTLNLSDPDSSTVVPASSPKFGGAIALDSQGDGELIFLQNAGSASQKLSRLSLGTQIDDSAWATSSKGTLYVTDNSDNKVYAISVTTKPGTVFVACPSGKGVVAGFVGTLDLNSGTITPVAIGFKNPHGLLFVPQTSDRENNHSDKDHSNKDNHETNKNNHQSTKDSHQNTKNDHSDKDNQRRNSDK
jgi:hypothetical protein